MVVFRLKIPYYSTLGVAGINTLTLTPRRERNKKLNELNEQFYEHFESSTNAPQ